MEKFLSSVGDKSWKNNSSNKFNNSKEKNKKSKSKPKPDNIIGNKIFFNTKNNSNIKNINNNSLYDLQDKLFIPKIVYSNNILGEKNKYNNIRLNSHGEKINNNNNNKEEDSVLSKYKEKINNKELKILELKEELKKLEKNYNDNNKNLMRRYQNSNKSNNRNVFLFYNSSRNGNNINANNKNKIKENKIMYKTNNKYNSNRKSYDKKKAKSTPKIGGYLNDIKNNYFFMMSNKKNAKNLNNLGIERGKTLDFKNKNNNNLNNNQIVINSINFNQTNNVKKININIVNNISQEIVDNSNLEQNKKDKYNIKKNWKNFPNTEPADKTNKQNNKINTFGNIANNFTGNSEEFENINTNNSAKNNIYINKQNMINCYSNNNFNNNLNKYINNNSDKVSNKNSNNNSITNNMINVLMKSNNSKTSSHPNNISCENKIYKFEKNIIYDEKNKFEILGNNIQYLFNQYFQYYNCKNNSNKK